MTSPLEGEVAASVALRRVGGLLDFTTFHYRTAHSARDRGHTQRQPTGPQSPLLLRLINTRTKANSATTPTAPK